MVDVTDVSRVNVAADRVRQRWAGVVDGYDAYRPSPPDELLGVLSALARTTCPTVVDLGSGTGLSSRAWAERAAHVVGIEPSAPMRRYAQRHTSTDKVSYIAATSEATSLRAGVADLVTASSAIHWMDPFPTFSEAARILRSDGVIAAYCHRNPLPLHCPEVATMYYEMRGRHNALEQELGLSADQPRWSWAESLAALHQHGAFVDTREFRMHAIEQWTAEHLRGWIMSTGQVQGLLRSGWDTSALGVDAVMERAFAGLGNEPTPWLFEYQVMVGRKAPAGEGLPSVDGPGVRSPSPRRVS